MPSVLDLSSGFPSLDLKSVVRDFLHCIHVSAAHLFSSQQLRPGGSGPYPSSYSTSPTLKHHTIYAPLNPPPDRKLPLLIWANGGSVAWGLMFSVFLREIASYGYVVIANGNPRELCFMGPKGIFDAVSWISQPLEGTCDIRTHINTSRIAIAGQSKGGIDVYEVAQRLRGDERIRTFGIFNSGLLPFSRHRKSYLLAQLNKPVFYFIGGPRDVAFKNAEADWDSEFFPQNLPAYKANLDVGHLATYYERNGGEFAEAAVHWLNYVLKGDLRSKEILLAYGTKRWNVQTRNL